MRIESDLPKPTMAAASSNESVASTLILLKSSICSVSHSIHRGLYLTRDWIS